MMGVVAFVSVIVILLAIGTYFLVGSEKSW